MVAYRFGITLGRIVINLVRRTVELAVDIIGRFGIVLVMDIGGVMLDVLMDVVADTILTAVVATV